MVAMRILLVEDDTRLRTLVARLMRLFGFRDIAQANNGEEALEHLAAGNDVDLILTDMNMPGMDGIAMVRQLRKQGDQTPVIMLTGESDAKTQARAKRVGVTHYVHKPIDADELSETIQQTLGEEAPKRRPRRSKGD
jgi:two-component system, chemotaxis family, chemotaxis protein CheY